MRIWDTADCNLHPLKQVSPQHGLFCSVKQGFGANQVERRWERPGDLLLSPKIKDGDPSNKGAFTVFDSDDAVTFGRKL